MAEAYDGGPVAALRRIGFLLERGREDTYKVKAFRGAAAAILPLSDDEVRARVEDGTLTKLPGVGASSAKVIAAAIDGELPERLAALETGARRPAHRGRPRAARPAPRRPALALGLVRRRLADRGDGVHRDRARPRVPGAHRPLAPAPRRQRAERRAAAGSSSASSTRSTSTCRQGERAASRCSRGSRSTSSTTAASTRPRRCSTSSTSGSPACTPSWPWTRRDMTTADGRRGPEPARQRARPLHRPDGDGRPRDPQAVPVRREGGLRAPAWRATPRSRSTPGPSAATRRPGSSSSPATSAACSRSTPTRTPRASSTSSGTAPSAPRPPGIDPDRIVNTWPQGAAAGVGERARFRAWRSPQSPRRRSRCGAASGAGGRSRPTATARRSSC